MLSRRMNQILCMLFLCCCTTPAFASNHDAYSYLKQLITLNDGTGKRLSGSEEEENTAKFIAKTLKEFGFNVQFQTFDVNHEGQQFTSSNVIAELENNHLPTIILGAHYDSKGADSDGAIDNGTGVGALMEIARIISEHPPKQYNIRFIAFGAEETDVAGSQHYVEQLTPTARTNIAGMINLDMIAGGDNLYIHSAHSKPYVCGKSDANYNGEPILRQAILNSSQETFSQANPFIIHPDFDGYPQGETGPWSDHFPFACAGIPIAYIESTNFSINGLEGFDGLSQTNNSEFWDCFDAATQGACDRTTEKRWGIILHTEFDRLDKIEAVFPNRIKKQLNDTVSLLSAFLLAPQKHFTPKAIEIKR